MKEKIIHECENGHHFIDNQCPFCDGKVKENYKYYEGDCVFCGNLCPGHAYGCTSPYPLEDDDFKKVK